jgi:signal transduction histidine kinase/CheY-like chemotaxis protein
MSGRAIETELKTTWSLLWEQKPGRAVAVMFALLAVIYLLGLGPDSLRASISAHLDRLVLPVLLALLIVRTRGCRGVEERRFWTFLIVGMSVWFMASLVNLLLSLAIVPRWVDLVVDILYIALYLSFFLASDQQPQREDGWSKGDILYRYSLVGATLFVVIMFGYFVVVPWTLHPAENLQYFASFNLYVTLDTLLAAKFGMLFLASRSARWRRCFSLLALMAAIMAVGDLVEGLGFAGIVTAVVGGRIDIVWIAQHFALATMILTCTPPPEDQDAGVGEAAAPRIQSLLPFYAFAIPLVHLGFYLFGVLDPAAHSAREGIVFFGLLFFAGLSVAQQIGLERAVASLRSDLMVRALGDKLRQSQRLESIGRLAGGIAHDFNNLLMVIKSYASLAENAVPADNRSAREKLGEIDRAADRAADLIRQLLAFGRRQVLNPEVVHVNEMVLGLEGMLSRIIGDDIELSVDLDEDAGFTRVDPALLEQVIVNLAVNARDAMPRGGRLSIRTRSVGGPPDDSAEDAGGARSVELVVTDSGTGIDPEVRERIFEPYFTTKEMEKGTGLGLATVYGIVEQSGGSIEVDSVLGEGSSFKVRLLQVSGIPADPVVPPPRASQELAGLTVLLTEDEANIREALAEYLESLGIAVIQAVDGVDALEMAERHDGVINVLVTDLVMPRMSGPDLAARLLSSRRDLKVVYVSGYTPDAMREYGANGHDAVFLQKPFLLSDLGGTIREVLDDR